MNEPNLAPVATHPRSLAEQRICCIDLGAWTELTRHACQLHHAVFVLEQKIQVTEITDQADETALHVLARDHRQHPIGTGRLISSSPGVGKVEFLAVSEQARGRGVGAVLLEALIAGARERGMPVVMLFAQHTACSCISMRGL